jgi:hypothetical protein
MKTQQLSTKASYFRIVLKKQNNRVEYRVLSSSDETYYTVQMHNGRAICCLQSDGEQCPARHYHPATPCKHMLRANELERVRREQQKIQQVLQSEKVAAMPDPVKQVAAQALQRYLAVCSNQIGVVEPPRTKEEWKAAQRRQKANDRAAAKEMAASLANIKAVQELAS